MIKTGMTHESRMTVSDVDTAAALGSGDMEVLATPALVALMENAAMLCAAPHLPDGQTTVGSRISVSHLRPTAVGRTVTASATLTAADGRRLEFDVTAEDENGTVGSGTHTRFIVDRNRFLNKL